MTSTVRRTTRHALILAALCSLAPTASASAADITVDTTADTTVAGGCTAGNACSLRDALNLADGPGDATDTITVPAGHYAVSAGQLSVGSSAVGSIIIVKGAGPGQTIVDAGGASRVLNVTNGITNLIGLTITGGQANAGLGQFDGDGAGILFGPNASGAVLNLDTVALTGNTAALGGGGIAAPFESPNVGTLNVSNSTIAGNKVTGGMGEAQGGGAMVAGDATFTNSTIANNTLDNGTGATARGAGLAAIINPSSTNSTTVTLNSSTVAKNSIVSGAPGVSFGGGYAGFVPVSLTGVTTSLVANNSIVANNDFAGAANDCASSNLIATSDNSLSSDASCSFTDDGSLQSTDPKLGALGDNGGPTQTMALQAGSPAIDAGVATSCPPKDQRGIARAQAKGCDMGAYERVFETDLAVAGSASPEPIVVGDNVVYTWTITNNGPDPATGVQLSDALPDGLTYVSSDGATNCSGTPVVCTLSDLAPGASTKLLIVAKTSKLGTLTNTATVGGTYDDPVASNNAATVTSTTVVPVVPRVTPRLTLSASIHKISKAGKRPRYRISAKGKLLDTGSQTCGGDVLIDVKVKTVRTILRQAKVNGDCTFTRKFDFSGLRIKPRLREKSKQHFRVVGRYSGTKGIKPIRVIKAARANK